MAPQDLKSQRSDQRDGPKFKVQVWIYRKKAVKDLYYEVLLLRLKPDRGGYWQPVTGGVDPGEAAIVAALREAREETGLEFESPPVPLDYQFRYYSPRYQCEYEEHVFALQASSVEARILLDPHEHVSSQWVDLEKARGLLHHSSNAEGLRRLVTSLFKEVHS